MCKLQTTHYIQEAKWVKENHTPSFKEQTDMSAPSTGLPLLFLAALTGEGHVVTQEAFQWAVNVGDRLRANCQCRDRSLPQ
ncbi:hypothetical protein ACP4OV_029929 [Aristida adscensionis]